MTTVATKHFSRWSLHPWILPFVDNNWRPPAGTIVTWCSSCHLISQVSKWSEIQGIILRYLGTPSQNLTMSYLNHWPPTYGTILRYCNASFQNLTADPPLAQIVTSKYSNSQFEIWRNRQGPRTFWRQSETPSSIAQNPCKNTHIDPEFGCPINSYTFPRCI